MKLFLMLEFYMIFARRMPAFYAIITRKNFPRFFFGGGASLPCPGCPPSSTPMLLLALVNQRCGLVSILIHNNNKKNKKKADVDRNLHQTVRHNRPTVP